MLLRLSSSLRAHGSIKIIFLSYAGLILVVISMKNFMDLALKIAMKADPFPNPRVGAVLVKGGEVIGVGYHKQAGLPHAEIEAIQNAKLNSSDPKIVEGATLYVTLEPCSHTNKRTPPCTGAIIANKIKRVVFAMSDPNPLVNGAEELRSAGIEVTGPTDEKKAASINKPYFANFSKT